MNKNERPSLRWFAGWGAAILGLWVGWMLAEIGYAAVHPSGIHIGGTPPRPVAYHVMAILCSIAGAVVGLALARWNDLPADE